MTVPETEREQRVWLTDHAREAPEHVPLRDGDTVIDFGCGAGAYALRAAELVGDDGLVYALDCDAGRLSQLRAAIAEAGVGSIEVIRGDGTTDIPLDDASCDAALLYDVLQNIKDWDPLPAELRRVVRHGGALSIYPMHLDPDGVRAAVEAAGFRFRDDFAGLVLNFVRK